MVHEAAHGCTAEQHDMDRYAGRLTNGIGALEKYARVPHLS